MMASHLSPLHLSPLCHNLSLLMLSLITLLGSLLPIPTLRGGEGTHLRIFIFHAQGRHIDKAYLHQIGGLIQKNSREKALISLEDDSSTYLISSCEN